MAERSTRRARHTDLDVLVALRAEMFLAMGISGHDADWRQRASRWFDERMDDSSHGIFVVEADDAVVACGMGAIRDAAPSPGVPDGSDILISNICTFEAFRGQGFGRAAFEAVLEWARGTGVIRFELMATPAGQSLYEQAGFVPTKSLAMRLSL